MVDFGNFEDEVQFTTVASTNSIGDVILGDGAIGVIHSAPVFAIVAGTLVSLRIRGRVNNLPKISGVAWSQNAMLYWDSVNLGLTTTPTLYPAGYAPTAQVSADVLAPVILSMGGSSSLIASVGAPVTGLTGTAEAVAATMNIPANLLISGQPLLIDVGFHATAQNSTDTLQTRIRVGGLTGTVISDSGAVQSAAGTAHKHSVLLTPEVLSATVGTAESAGSCLAAATAKTVGASLTSLNTTATIAVAITYVFSSASAGDTATLVAGTIQRVPAA